MNHRIVSIVAILAALIVVAPASAKGPVGPSLAVTEALSAAQSALGENVHAYADPQQFGWDVKAFGVTSCKRQRADIFDCRYDLRAEYRKTTTTAENPEWPQGWTDPSEAWRAAARPFTCSGKFRVRKYADAVKVRDKMRLGCTS